MTDPIPLLTTAEALELVRARGVPCHPATLRRWIAAYGLGVRVGARRLLVDRAALDRLLTGTDPGAAYRVHRAA